MTEPPDLMLLDETVLPEALRGRVSVRNLRAKARQLGQCFVIGRKTYVTKDQLAALLESFRLVPRAPPEPRLRHRLPRSEAAEYERALRRAQKKP